MVQLGGDAHAEDAPGEGRIEEVLPEGAGVGRGSGPGDGESGEVGLKKLAFIFLLVAVAAYAWLPYYTVDRLETALRAADKTALDRLVDFAAVRQSLKDQFKAKLSG